MGRSAHYPVTHTQIKTLTASSGAQQVSIENAFLGPILERILVALFKISKIVCSASAVGWLVTGLQRGRVTSLLGSTSGTSY